MGDLVLLESEVNPVIAKLRSSGFDISAVHNHLMEESPRVLYAHYMGHGPAVELATSLRSALALSKTPLEKPATATEEAAHTGPHGLGQKSSDLSAIPLCRVHHRAVHRCGNEGQWWSEAGVDPLKVAERLWKKRGRGRCTLDRNTGSHAQPEAPAWPSTQ